MSKTTPEFEKANAELQRARTAAAQATFQKWEIYGMPWNLRIKLMFLTGSAVLWIFCVGYMLWSAYETQQKWNDILLKRPDLSDRVHNNYLVYVIPALLLILINYPQIKRLGKIYKETDGFPDLRKETVIFMALGVATITLIIITFRYCFKFLLGLF